MHKTDQHSLWMFPKAFMANVNYLRNLTEGKEIYRFKTFLALVKNVKMK